MPFFHNLIQIHGGLPELFMMPCHSSSVLALEGTSFGIELSSGAWPPVAQVAAA